MTDLRVYGGCIDGNSRFIIASTSQRRAATIINKRYFSISLCFVREHLAQTWKKEEVRAATERPEVLFSRPLNSSGAFVPCLFRRNYRPEQTGEEDAKAKAV